MVFGCLLHNEEPKYMEAMVSQACPMLIANVLNDASIAVRDSSAWVLSQICTSYLLCIPSELSNSLIECLITALDMEPRVAQHAAMGISSIADAVSQPPNSAILAPYYNTLLQKLVDCAEKTGAANNQLRENAAYRADQPDRVRGGGHGGGAGGLRQLDHPEVQPVAGGRGARA